MNLGLVVFIAKTYVDAAYGISECVSDGSFALIRAVDLFDFARGTKFSTYAARSIRNHLWWNKQRFIRRCGLSLVPFEASLATFDSNLVEPSTEQGRERLESAVRRWLGRLNERERRIIICRYGLGGVPEQTLTQLGQHLGISKQRVRQNEQWRRRQAAETGAFLEGIESSKF